MKINSVNFGKCTGSIGGTTTQNWKGINVARTKPTEVANPQTEAQTETRSKFSFVQALSRELRVVSNIGFAKAAIKKTIPNVFQQLNMLTALYNWNSGTPLINYDYLVLSKGSSAPFGTVAGTVSGQNVDIEYSEPSGIAVAGTAPVYGVAVSPTGQLISMVEATLADAQLTIAIPSGTTPSACKYFAFYVNPANGQPSDSVLVAVS